MQTAIAVIFLVLISGLILQVAASRGFRARNSALVAKLRETPPTRPAAGLPQLVQEFAIRAGAEAGSRLRLATLLQDGEMRISQGGRFGRFAAWQAISLGAPGFVWLARQDVGPFPKLRITDAYVRREGRLEARLIGSIPVARASGRTLTLGEAYRYLAELPWAPDAILGNPDLEWRITARNIAEVRLATPAGAARVSFRFDAAGDIVEISAKDRPARDASGNEVLRDWRGYFGDYRQIGPRRIPGTAEVGYVYPEGYEAYFRCKVTEYHLAT